MTLRATDVSHLLRRLDVDPGRPRLTWYGTDGERVELSGHVLANWVTKSTNLLVEEHDAGPRTTVLLDLPVHWRTVVWALAVWRTGGCLRLPDAATTAPPDSSAPDPPVPGPRAPLRQALGRGDLTAADIDVADLVITDRPQDAATTRAELIAVALPALARSFGGPLPAGATDAASAVMTYPDQLGWVPPTDLTAPALDLPGGTGTVDPLTIAGSSDPTGADLRVPHGSLLPWAAQATARWWPHLDPETLGPDTRALLAPTNDPVAGVLGAALTVYVADGSLVLCSPDVAAELAADPERQARLVETERITS